MSDTTTALRIVCGHDSWSVVGCLHCEAADLITQLRAHIAEQRAAAAPAGELVHLRETVRRLRASLTIVTDVLDDVFEDYVPTSRGRSIDDKDAFEGWRMQIGANILSARRALDDSKEDSV